MRTIALSLLAAVLSGCASEEQPAPDVKPPTDGTRLVLVNRTTDTVWAQVRTEIDPVGWLGIWQGETPLTFEERCDLPICGRPPAICGAMLPAITRLAPGDSIAHPWDGRLVQVVQNPVGGGQPCQQRLEAGEGRFTARACIGDSTPVEGERPMGRRLQNIQCVEVPFDRPTDRVLLRLGEG